jgi:hypothetical protein
MILGSDAPDSSRPRRDRLRPGFVQEMLKKASIPNFMGTIRNVRTLFVASALVCIYLLRQPKLWSIAPVGSELVFDGMTVFFLPVCAMQSKEGVN